MLGRREWAAVASLNDHGMRLRPEHARALADELDAVLARWMTDAPRRPPGRRHRTRRASSPTSSR